MFDSCSSGPKVTLIHGSYFLALIKALSVCEVRGCESTSKSHIALIPLSRGMTRTRQSPNSTGAVFVRSVWDDGDGSEIYKIAPLLHFFLDEGGRRVEKQRAWSGYCGA